MLEYFIIIVSVGILCAGWAVLQLWIERRAPGVRSIFERGCGGRGDCGDACDGRRCEERG